MVAANPPAPPPGIDTNDRVPMSTSSRRSSGGGRTRPRQPEAKRGAVTHVGPSTHCRCRSDTAPRSSTNYSSTRHLNPPETHHRNWKPSHRTGQGVNRTFSSPPPQRSPLASSRIRRRHGLRRAIDVRSACRPWTTSTQHRNRCGTASRVTAPSSSPSTTRTSRRTDLPTGQPSLRQPGQALRVGVATQLEHLFGP